MKAATLAMQDNSARPRRWPWVLLVATIAVAAGLYGLLSYGALLTASSSTAPRIGRWVAPQMRLVRTTVTATGTVRLKTGAEVRVGAEVSGIVQKLNVVVGSRVNKGDVIAEIDSRAISASVAQARAQLEHDEAALAKAKLDDARMRRLIASGAVSMQQADDARAALRLVQATVDISRSALDAAKVSLSYVSIRAPITGTISSVSTQQGETVAAAFATPTFVTIIADNALEVVAMVDEADIGAVHLGDTTSFTTETYPDIDFAGQVVRIAPVATIVSGVVNYEVAIAIAGDMARLKPDMTTNVTIETASRSGLFVPAQAVQQTANGKYVLVRAKNGSRIARRVQAAGRKSGGVEILKGLSAKDQVLVEDKP